MNPTCQEKLEEIFSRYQKQKPHALFTETFFPLCTGTEINQFIQKQGTMRPAISFISHPNTVGANCMSCCDDICRFWMTIENYNTYM